MKKEGKNEEEALKASGCNRVPEACATPEEKFRQAIQAVCTEEDSAGSASSL